MRQPHARPLWQIQSEEIERHRRRAHRRRVLRQWIDYAGLALLIGIIVAAAVVLVNEI